MVLEFINNQLGKIRLILPMRVRANVESKSRRIIGVTKSRLNSSVEVNIEPASILFHKLEFIKTRE